VGNITSRQVHGVQDHHLLVCEAGQSHHVCAKTFNR
jgi:hypothetical protein